MRIWPRAIHYYEQSQRFFGERHESVYNLALCYLENNNKSKASEFFAALYHLILHQKMLNSGWNTSKMSIKNFG
ncbi:hypothetical protein [Coxiella burnetii]|uniref:hypothetical protein n=1 Tax=Coxiella burnetii TaxID=777 RepID=UPI000A65DAE5|nr:hypothetical protein [Coxiella burnetii]